jgi:hypothetical protein
VNVSLITAGTVLLVANVAGWAIGAATTAPVGVVLTAMLLLGLCGAWLMVSGQPGPQRARARLRAGAGQNR